MDSLDKASRDVLRKIYKQFESTNEINVSSPDYKKTMIDYLIDHGLLGKIDASSLSGWAYIIQPTYKGEMAVSNDSVIEENMNHAGKTMKKKYQVFISSTYRDLVEERAAVSQCLLDCGCIPVGMEQFPASGMSQMDYIKKMLADCDYYILILAGRYGSLDSDGIGFTEKEYDYAKSMGLPVMSFVIEDPGKLQANRCDDNDEGRNRLKAFRKKVCSNSLVKMFKNCDDLKAAVAVSLIKCIQDFPATGWVRASKADSNDDVAKQVKDYLEKLSKLPGARMEVKTDEAGENTLVFY